MLVPFHSKWWYILVERPKTNHAKRQLAPLKDLNISKPFIITSPVFVLVENNFDITIYT